MKFRKKGYIALKDIPGIIWADLSQDRDPNDPYANDPYFVKKNEEAQRQLKETFFPKDFFEKFK